ncbi:UNVERIFIED_ORG: hypothetical protein B2H93_15885 [Clostridium botulinum]
MEKEILELLKCMQKDIKDINTKVDRIEKKLNSVHEQTADLTEFRTETKYKLNTVSQDVKFVKHKVQETEEDVFSIQSHLKIIK